MSQDPIKIILDLQLEVRIDKLRYCPTDNTWLPAPDHWDSYTNNGIQRKVGKTKCTICSETITISLADSFIKLYEQRFGF